MLIKIFLLSFVLFVFTNISVLADNTKKRKKTYKKCAVCHNVNNGEKHKTSRNLSGIYCAKSMVQNVKTECFVKVVKKSKMIFASLRKPEQIANVIANFKTLK